MTTMYADPSCYHATLATVLRWHGCADPPLVLGSSASSNAYLEGSTVRFRDNYPALTAACASRGYLCSRRLTHDSGSWEATVGRLQLGYPVIGLVDPFHLPYYWIGYQRVHSQHAVVLWWFDKESRQIHLSDPSDIFRYEATVPLADVSNAWTAEDRGQAWLDVEPLARSASLDRATLLRELKMHAHALVAVREEELSCVSLAQHVLNHFEHYLDLTLRVSEPEPRLGTDIRRRQSSHFLRGIWNFHHTLRWLALYTHGVANTCEIQPLGPVVRPLQEIAQNWLVVRNLLIKHAMSTPKRRPALAETCAQRLQQIAMRAEQLTPKLVSHIEASLANADPVGGGADAADTDQPWPVVQQRGDNDRRVPASGEL
jgi:Butirosin biosynthesis protein H, N-terminal